jgi:hypothetical protein
MLDWVLGRRTEAEAVAGADPDAARMLAERASALVGADRRGAFEAAAEAALREGDLATARRCLGEAIDDAIADDDLEAAFRLCRRLSAVDPAVVRVHCTLAFLAIARADAPGVESALADYVAATVATGGEALSRAAIQLMARATADPRIRGSLADALEALGDPAAAASMRLRARAGGALRRLIDDGGHERWKMLLRSATATALRR